MRFTKTRALFVLLAVLPVALGCSFQERRAAAGFVLPAGDVERGKTAFVEFRCYQCHRVAGVPLPSPVAEPAIPIVLGGKFAYAPTDGEIVTSIINPSHDISARYARDMLKSGSLSRMGDFSQGMTVSQLVDLVAFLHVVFQPASVPTRTAHAAVVHLEPARVDAGR
jgi:hypothetical protein